MTVLNRPIRKGFANLQVQIGKLLDRTQCIVCLGTGLVLAACSSQPYLSTDQANKDVIDTTDLAAYYHFNGSAKDASRNGNDGTVHGGDFVADRFGRPASAYAFNGVDSYISIPSTESLDAVLELSIAVWLYHKTQDQQNKWYSLVEKSDPERNGHSRYGMWLIRDLVELCVQPVDLKLPHRCLDSETTLQPEQWHHLAGVSDGRILRVYVDGQLAGEKDFGSSTTNSVSNYDLFLGTDLYDASPIYAKGAIDELRVYTRALSQAEVVTLYQSKHP